MNPRQMKQAMKKMGLQQQDLNVKQAVFKMQDKELVINNPSVSKINVMGQETYQVVGEVQEQPLNVLAEISDDDVQMVVEQVDCSKEDAEKALKNSKGDLAEAILNLKNSR